MKKNSKWEWVPWEDIVPRLLLYTIGRLRRMVWRGAYGGEIPGGLQPNDFVGSAIVKTISGERVWDHTKSTLLQHLIGVISSEINHLADSRENRLGASTATSGYEVARLEEPAAGPEDDAISENYYIELLAYLEESDLNLKRLAEMMLSGVRGSVELSNVFGMSVNEINNLKKRLRRATEAFSAREVARNIIQTTKRLPS